MTYVSLIFFAFGFYVVLYHLADIKKQLKEQAEAHQLMLQEQSENNRLMLKKIIELVNNLCILQEHHNEDYNNGWHELAKSLEEICQALNQTFTTAGGYMDFTTTALQHTLICLRPFVNNTLNLAVDREDYKTAKECKQILDNLDMMIKFNPQNKN